MPDPSEKPSPATTPNEAFIIQAPASIAPTAASLAEKAHDLGAIRDAVVDAAKVSAGLWLSYLFVLFYLLVASGGVTHKDLLLESPVKLPFLNVDLPLVGFFWFGPVIFLVVHAYVLLHFRMLSGKVSVFDHELRAQIDPGQDESDTRARLRRQLPNDIFVQFLAGPPEVRRGVTGALLELIAWISLVLGPIFLLAFFQLQFLPYHDAWITWWHRIALLLDLILLWLLWPTVVRSAQVSAWRRGTRLAVAGIATLLPLYLIFLIASFPGEWHYSHLSPLPFQKQLVDGQIDLENVIVARKPNSLWSNRLVLTGFDVVDHTRFDKQQKISALPVTASLRTRDLRNAVFIDASLAQVDFSSANLKGADFYRAHLENAVLEGAHLEGAVLRAAHSEHAHLAGAHMEGALLAGAYLQGVDVTSLRPDLERERVHLEGADLENANLQGANLVGAHLEGADLKNANLQGADLTRAYLQGADLTGAQLGGVLLKDAFIWRALISGESQARQDMPATETEGAHVVEPVLEPCPDSPKQGCHWSTDSLQALNQRLEQEKSGPLPWPALLTSALKRLKRLDPGSTPQSTEAASEGRWRVLKELSSGDTDEAELIKQWRRIGCDWRSSPYVFIALTNKMDTDFPARNSPRLPDLATAFLDPACAGGRGMSEETRAKLEEIRTPAVPAAAPAP